MSRSVNEIQHIFLPILLVFHLDGMTLDGDASLFLQVHIVEHLPFCDLDGVGVLQQAICQGRLTVVYVCDDAEITYMLHCGNLILGDKDNKNPFQYP